jgi:hypothetical protein
MQDYDATGRRRLEPPAEDDWAAGSSRRRRAVERRDTGVRQTRRLSSWTAAALVAGVAASAGYFAHTAMTPAGPTTGASATGTVAGTGTATGQKPSVTHAVVTSGGSGVAVGTSSGASGGSAGSGGAVHWRDN